MKKTLVILLALLMLAAAAGCKPAATAPPTAAPTAAPTAEPTAAPPKEIKDILGNTIRLEKAPERIVSLTPSNTEIVYALGLGGKLVGVDAISDYPEAVKNLPKVGDFNGPNLETVAGLQPDLVLAGNKLQKDVIDKLNDLGLTVAAVEATSFADVYKSIELVGLLTGAEARAAEVVADMKAGEQAVLDAVAKAGAGKTAYYAMSYGEFGNWTGGPGSFPYEFIEMCGGRNITEGLAASWINLTLEELVAQDPDVILFANDAGDVEAFRSADRYKELKAVKDGKVFVVTGSLCSRPGPRMVEGLREFARAITGQEIPFPGQ